METPLFVLFFPSAAINMWHNQVASLISDGPAKKKYETRDTLSLSSTPKKCGMQPPCINIRRFRSSSFFMSLAILRLPRRKTLCSTIWETLLRTKMASPAGVSQRHSRFEYGREQHRISNRFNCPLPPSSLIQLRFRVNCKMAKHLGETTLPAE